MASLGDELFIVNFSSKQQVEVYRASTFTLRRFLVVPGLSLGGSCDLAVCERNSCLYVPDWFTNTVHRVELSGGNEVMKWSVERNPVGLSVNGDDHLIVVSRRERKLQVFTTHGTLLRNIQLQAGIDNPQNAVQLANGQLIITNSSHVSK